MSLEFSEAYNPPRNMVEFFAAPQFLARTLTPLRNKRLFALQSIGTNVCKKGPYEINLVNEWAVLLYRRAVPSFSQSALYIVWL